MKQHLLTFLLSLGFLSAALAAGPEAPAVSSEAESASVELTRFNAEYRNLDQGIAPINQGGITILFSSPEHVFTVYSNRLELAPADAEGVLPAALEVDFEGAGRIIAEISAGSAGGNKIEDAVEAPRQTIRVEGKIRLAARPDGYLVTLVERPDTAQLDIKSQMAQNLLGLCQLFERLPFVPVDCSGLGAALSVVTAPLPEPGTELLLPNALLTEDEQSFLAGFAETSP